MIGYIQVKHAKLKEYNMNKLRITMRATALAIAAVAI